MRGGRQLGRSSALAILSIAACHHGSLPGLPTQGAAERTVFTDSILHAERCAPLKLGEDWHRVCTPLDQSAPRPIRNKP